MAHSTASVKPSGLLCFVNLDPESLYPWRPDCTYLLAIHPFTFLIHFAVNKAPFTDSVVLQSVLLYV
ncbi:hypothetical protein ATANTOWER_019530, partial [Ataeniobius toweri]|nr:hypothetical protein [Ataeniobius toweri]